MKKIISISLLAVLLFSCSDDDDKNTTLNVSATSVSLNILGETETFEINSDGSWEITVNDEYFSVNPKSGSGNAVVSIEARPNHSYAEHSTTITVKGCQLEKQVTVSQVPNEVINEHLSPSLLAFCLESFDTDDNDEVTAMEVAEETELIFNPFISPVSDLTGIGYFVSLEVLQCPWGLPELDVTKNRKLVSLTAFAGSFDNLDLSRNTLLEELTISSFALTSIDISNNPELVIFSCTGTSIEHLDLSNNIKIRELFCHSNHLESINASGLPELETLNIASNDIRQIDLGSNTELRSLTCSGNLNLTNIDLSKNPQLESLSIELTGIEYLDISNNRALTFLQCVDFDPDADEPKIKTIKVWDSFDEQTDTEEFILPPDGVTFVK